MRKVVLTLVAITMTVAACRVGGGGGGGKAAAPRTTVPTRPVESPLRAVQGYVDDFNRGDLTAAVLRFAPDAQFITPLGGCAPCVGRGAIQAKLAGAIAAKTQLSITNPRTRGDTVTAPASLTSPQLPAGVQRAIGTFTATVRGGSIVRSTMEYDPSDPQTAALLASVGSTPTAKPPN